MRKFLLEIHVLQKLTREVLNLGSEATRFSFSETEEEFFSQFSGSDGGGREVLLFQKF